VTPSDPRLAELAANLADVQARIGTADVTLIAVTKTWPATDVRRLAALGISDFGENRDQEAAPKAADVDDLELSWHFVGRLQANKAASAARYADVVHSVDRPRLVQALSHGAVQAGRQVAALIQISLDRNLLRGGAAPEDVHSLADEIAAADGLVLRGVMAVAPLGAPPEVAFARLAELHGYLLRDHPEATWRSAGMSGDLEAAVRSGATHLRVGTALLGPRPPLG
jgi:PLP dependent protein